MRIRTLTAMYLLVCAFVFPLSAGANVGFVIDSSQSGGDPDTGYSSVTSITPPVSEANSSGSTGAGSDYASLNAIAARPPTHGNLAVHLGELRPRPQSG